MSELRTRPVHLLAALGVAFAVALMVTDPAWRQPHDLIVGLWQHPDHLSNHWLLAWVAEQVMSGGDLLHNDRYYWPIGDAPLLAGNGSEGFLYLPFHAVMGWPAGVPYYLLMVFTLNGLAGWAVARAAGAGPWAALSVIGVTGAAPFAIQELSGGRFSQVDFAWLLFFLAAWMRLLERPSYGRAALAGGLLAVTSFLYWYYGWFGVIAGALTLVARGRAWPPPKTLLVFATTFLALIGPWAVVFAYAWAAIPGTAEPQFPHPQALQDVGTLMWPFQVGAERSAGQAMPGTLWMLGTAGILWGWRHGPTRRAALGLVLVWGAFTALFLGPISDVSPYSLVYGLAAPLRRFWWPSRHIIVANTALAALGALLLTRIPAPRGRRWPHAILGGGLALSAPWLLHLQGAPAQARTSPVTLDVEPYTSLAALPDGVLIEPPLNPTAAGTQQQLIYQRVHGKPLMSGHALWVDRVRPDAWDAYVAQNSFLVALQQLEAGELSGPLRFDPADLTRLRNDGARWVCLNREYFVFGMKPALTRYDTVFDTLFGRPVIRAKGAQVWDLKNWTGAHEVDITPWQWPAQLHPAGPEMPLTGRRPASQAFDP